MKFILTLFLCAGVAYAIASPTCSEREVNNCDKYDILGDEDLSTQEYLNGVCRYAYCLKDYKDRCGVESVDTYLQSVLIHSEKVHRLLCNTDSYKLRRLFMDNIRCINRAIKASGDECRVKGTIDFKDPEYCPRIAASLDCLNDSVGRECGNDARAVNEATGPGLEFHGCKE